MAALDELSQRLFEGNDLLYRQIVEIAVREGEQADDFFDQVQRRVLGLFQYLDGALSALELASRERVQIARAELREGLKFSVLGEVAPESAGHLLNRLRLCGATDARNRKSDVDRRSLAGVEQVGFQVDLAVGDRDDVGRNVCRHVVCLRLDDRQRRERPTAKLGRQLGSSFQQPAVQVENVARVRLAPGRPAQQQRHLAVRPCVLAEVVIYDQGVLALLHELLTHGATGIRGKVL